MDKNVTIKQQVFTITDYSRAEKVSLGKLPKGMKIFTVNCSTDAALNTVVIKGDVTVEDGVMYFSCLVGKNTKSSNRVTAYVAFVPE